MLQRQGRRRNGRKELRERELGLAVHELVPESWCLRAKEQRRHRIVGQVAGDERGKEKERIRRVTWKGGEGGGGYEIQIEYYISHFLHESSLVVFVVPQPALSHSL